MVLDVALGQHRLTGATALAVDVRASNVIGSIVTPPTRHLRKTKQGPGHGAGLKISHYPTAFKQTHKISLYTLLKSTIQIIVDVSEFC